VGSKVCFRQKKTLPNEGVTHIDHLITFPCVIHCIDIILTTNGSASHDQGDYRGVIQYRLICVWQGFGCC